MPKKLEYANASFKDALELSETVKSLSGSCNIKTCSEKLNKKGGRYLMIVSAAVKFGLITRRQSQLTCTENFNLYKLSYNEEEKIEWLKKFFFNSDFFKDIYEKYKKVELPVAQLNKIFTREFGVEEKNSSRIAKYFVDGARQIKILNQDNNFVKGSNKEKEEIKENLKEETITDKKSAPNLKSKNFSVRITGQGLDHLTEIEDEGDLIIVNAILEKIKRKIEKEK